jgi:hypothetical protein
MDRVIARLDADKVRPIDGTSPIGTSRSTARPLVQVGRIYGKAVAWSRSYGLIEWLDVSGKYHLGWAHSASIKRVTAEEWKGNSGL